MRIRNLSINAKLFLAMTAVLLVALVIVILYALLSQRQAMERDLYAKVETVADVLAANLVSSVEFRDAKSIEELFYGAKQDKDFLEAQVEDLNGEILARSESERSKNQEESKNQKNDSVTKLAAVHVPQMGQPPNVVEFGTKLFVVQLIVKIDHLGGGDKSNTDEKANAGEKTNASDKSTESQKSVTGPKPADAKSPETRPLTDIVKKTPMGVLRISYSLEDYYSKTSRMLLVGLLIGGGVFIVGLLLVGFIGLRISRPLRAMTITFRRMAEGDLSQALLPVTSRDEMGLMAAAFNELKGGISQITSKFNELSDIMERQTTEILATAKEQEAGAAEQAATVAEVTSTMEELAATARQIAGNTDSVTKSTEEAASAVTEGRDALSSLVQSMNSIEDGNKTINDNIVQLNRHVQQIRGIVDLINDIADRSDLLALNAALEGTKAGEAGKGFMLVAAEMRRLAENVFSSTAEIKQLIGEVTEATNTAVMATESGMRLTREGVERAEQAERSFYRIVETIEETIRASKQISMATQQQHTGTEQAVSAMDGVSSVAQQWVTGIRDTTRSVGELGSITSQLKSIVAKYRLTEGK